MPQLFHVVKCYKCETFQVQIVKNTNKFDCKMCGEKQSVKKEYGNGTAKDCRLHVQKLNDLRLRNEYKMKHETAELSNQSELFVGDFELNDEQSPVVQKSTNSKWSEHLHLSEETHSSSAEDEIPSEFANFTFERPNKRKKFSNSNVKKSKSFYRSENDDIKHDSYLSDAIDTKKEINKSKWEVNDASNEFNFSKSKLVDDKKYLTKVLTGTKKSKWIDFVPTNKKQVSENDSEFNFSLNNDNQNHVIQTVKNIFTTDDDNLDDILNL